MTEQTPAEEALAVGPLEEEERQPPRLQPLRRGLGVPWLFAAVYS